MRELYHIGQEIGTLKTALQKHCDDYQSTKDSHDKRLSSLELWIGLIRRGLIVIGLWIGSLTGQLNTDQIASIAVSILKRVLTGG